MQLSLKRIVTPHPPIAILIILVCAGLWFIPTMGETAVSPIVGIKMSPIAMYLQSLLFDYDSIAIIITLGLALLNTYLLMYLNSRYTLIREKTFLLFFSFFLLLSVCKDTHLFFVGQVATLFVLLSFFVFLGMYNNRTSVEHAFMGSFLFGCSIVLVPQLAVFILAFLFGFSVLQASSARTDLAALLGVITPLIIYFSILIILGYEQSIMSYVTCVIPIFFEKDVEQILTILPYDKLIFGLVLLLMFLIAVGGAYSDSLKDALRTRRNLNFMLVFQIFAILFCILYIDVLTLVFPIIVIGFCVFFAHATSLRNSNFYAIIFILFCVLNVAYFGYQIIEPLL